MPTPALFAPRPARADEPRRTMEQVRMLGRPRATGKAVGLEVEAKPGAPPEAVAYAAEAQRRIDEYLSHFVAPEEDYGCIMCGLPQGGLFGAAEWGLAHGEARCGRCGYPSRGQHYISIDDEKDDPGELRIPRLLQYHPDEVTAASSPPRGPGTEGDAK